MSPLKRHVQAAEGFLELGLPLLAQEEIDAIEPEHHTFPVVLRLKVEICRTLQRWTEMESPARILSEGEPHESYGWINWAYAARRIRGLDAARDILRRALAHHREEAIVQYNLACYECQLGRLDEARANLRVAFRLDGKFRGMARADSDLAPLHGEI